MDKKTLIVIIGPSCAGKSTIATKIFENTPGIVHVKSDTLKRFISHYTPQEYKKVVAYLTQSYCESVMKEGLSLLVEPHRSESKEGDYIDLAHTYSYHALIVFVHAPYEVVCERFKERVANYTASGAQGYINTDENRFKETYLQYQSATIAYDLSVDTSTISPDEAYDMIMRKL